MTSNGAKTKRLCFFWISIQKFGKNMYVFMFNKRILIKKKKKNVCFKSQPGFFSDNK